MRKKPSQESYTSQSRDMGSITTVGSISERPRMRRLTSRAIINCQTLAKAGEHGAGLKERWGEYDNIPGELGDKSEEREDSLLQELVDILDTHKADLRASLKSRSALHSPRIAEAVKLQAEDWSRPAETVKKSLRKVKSVKLIFKGHGAVVRRREGKEGQHKD